MKILTISYSDIIGGAAIAAYRIHRGLVDAGYDAQMMVQVKSSDDPTVLAPDTKLGKAMGAGRQELDKLIVNRYKNRSHTRFSPGWLPFSLFFDRINQINPDIIHLNWMANSFFPVKDFKKFKRPVVWSMHDMWGFTGGCHYDENCGKYVASCGSCPVLGSNKKNDISRRLLKKKLNAYSKIKNLTVNGPSKWMAESAQKSTLFRNSKVTNIPYAIDTKAFRPIDKQKAKNLLRLPQDKKLVVFGAMNATSDPRKGFNELSESLQKLDAKNTELVVFGSSKPIDPPDFSFPVHYLGKLHDELSMQLLYSAADVVVVPSIQENLSNVVIESLACGTPVVAFDIGGNADMIDHQVNGYLVPAYQTDQMAAGISWVINHSRPEQLRKQARDKVLDNYDERIVVPQYVKLYQEMMAGSAEK